MKIITFRKEPRFVIGYWKYTHCLAAGTPYVFFDREIEKIQEHHTYYELGEMEPEPRLYGGEDLDGKSLLFASLGGYGDALCFLQALNTLQARYPGACIDISSHMDIYLFIHQFGFRGGWLSYPLKLSELRCYDYYQTSDTVFDFEDAYRSNISRLYGRILHAAPDLALSSFTPVDLPESRPAGAKGERRKRAAIQVNTEKGSHRNYPPDKIARLAELLCEGGFQVFLVGNAAHPSLPSHREGVHNCIGRTSTPLELAGLLRLMDVIITPDSLSAHIGGTMGIPTVVLFNVTGREKTDHYGSVVPLHPGSSCSPCYDLFRCPKGYSYCRALDDGALSPETVFETVDALVDRSGDDSFPRRNEVLREVSAS